MLHQVYLTLPQVYALSLDGVVYWYRFIDGPPPPGIYAAHACALQLKIPP